MTVLADNEILSLLHPLPADLPRDHLALIAKGGIPNELKQLLKDGRIFIDPLPEPDAIGPCSVNLQLGNWIEIDKMPLELTTVGSCKTIRRYSYDARTSPCLLEDDRKVEITEYGTHIKFRLHDDETFELPTGSFLIAPTKERLYVPTNLVVMLQGRSRFARKGITVELSSSRFDPGWCGTLVMEIANMGPACFNLFPGLPLCAITFERLSSTVLVPYFAKKNASFRGQQ